MNLQENRFCLPVSGRVVCVRPLSGTEDLLLAESSTGDTELALALADRLARDVEGARLDWRALAVTDLDAFILFLRRTLLGDKIRADVSCGAADCGQRFDIDFGLEQFLHHHTPVRPVKPGRGWSIQPAQEQGWYRLAPLAEVGASSIAAMDFRLPTPTDQLAVSGRPNAEAQLAQRCLRPAHVPAPLRRKAEAAMEAMAPCLTCELEAVCPECGTGITLYFEPRRFCLRELCDRAASVYADVDILARRYNWTEDQILALPRSRRVTYVELARPDQSN